ncbi:ribonuclease H-like domain-containing protein [Tanacetum coccineum]|uniref:Ribonuclease H-like domain-containing protein n=1 Tax=Tanacetum coccineum TaxID=301880 RepID=A0ABQ5AH67_9ASTR
MHQTVPSKSTANVTYQDTARSRVPQAVLSRSTDGSYYQRMDSRRPRISSYSPSSRSSTTRAPHRPQRPKKIVKLIWVKKGSTVGSQAVLPQTVKKSAMLSPKQTWKPKGKYLDSVNKGNGSYTLKQFEYGNPKRISRTCYLDSGCSVSMTGDKDKLSDFKEFKGGYVAFGNDSKGGRISGKGTIKTSCLDFEKNKEFYPFSKGSSLLMKIGNSQMLLERMMSISPGSNEHYSFCGITCLLQRQTEDEAVLWHRRQQISVGCISAYKDETYDMLHDLIVGLENRLRHKVKTIRCDHGTEFKNQLMNEFCAKKGIKREYSIARTPQQNGVAERKNRTLIEAARTMLADSLLPIQFWAEAVNTACYVLNRVLVTKPQMKTPYEILMGRSPNISFMRPFGCPLTILNTLDHLGKFDGKSEEGYLLGYSTNSKGFRVYNRVTRKVQDCLHVNFLENQENQKGKGPDWMFDLDLLTPSMNYIPVRKENYADSKEQGITCDDAEDLDDQQFIVHTTQYMPPVESTAAKEVKLSSEDQALHDELVSLMNQESLAKAHNDDQRIAFEEEKRRISIAKGKETFDNSDDDTPTDGVFSTNSFDAEEGGVADYNNLDSTIDVPSTPTLRIHKIHPQSQIIGKSTAGVQTRRKLQDSTSNQHQALLSFIYKQNRTNHKDSANMLVFALFLSQEEAKESLSSLSR